MEILQLTTASCWSSTNAWASVCLSQTDVICFLILLSRPVWFQIMQMFLPQIWGSSIQDLWLDRVMRGESEGLWSIRSNKTLWLWTVKQFMYSEDGEIENGKTRNKKRLRVGLTRENVVVGIVMVLRWYVVCMLYIPTYWSRSRNRSPPCPWSVSWRFSTPKPGTVGTAILPPAASQHSRDTTSNNTCHSPKQNEQQPEENYKLPNVSA